MSERVRRQKEEAARLIAKGRLTEAAEQYAKIVKGDTRDLMARQQLAELHGRLGMVTEAVAGYQSVAGRYAADGLLLKAIAVCKLILQIDPSHTQTQGVLASLSTKRRGEAGSFDLPTAMSAALLTGKRTDERDVAAANVMSAAVRSHAGPGSVVPARAALPSGVVPPRPPPARPELSTDAARALMDAFRVGAMHSAEGADVIVAAAASQEDALLDESSAEGREPARIEVDKIPPIPLFSDLSQQAFIALTERMDLRVAAKGDVLVQEGDVGTSMFIVIQGKVIVQRQDLDAAPGAVVRLAELGDGAFFGEMALLSDTPRMASVVCAEPTMFFQIRRELLADITREHPSVDEVMRHFHKNRLLMNFLQTSPVFQPFATSDKKHLIEKFKSRSVEQGTVLITRARPGDGLYVLLSGRCDVYDKSAAGEEVLVARLKAGDVFGEMSMLWHKETCASVKTTTPCVVLRMPRATFNEVIVTHPLLLQALSALGDRRAQDNRDWAARLAPDCTV